MSSRALTLAATVIAIGFGLCILLLGYSSASGSPHFDYRPNQVPSQEQYWKDQQFLCSYLESAGFEQRNSAGMPTQFNRLDIQPEGFTLVAFYEYPIRFSRPIYLKLYSDPKRSGFRLFYSARNPTWAVPSMKMGIEKLRRPLYEVWGQRLDDEKAR